MARVMARGVQAIAREVHLAARNLVRQRTRTGITLAAIAVGVAALILTGGFVQDIFVQLGEALIHSRSGHLQVARSGFFAGGERAPERYLIADPEALARRIAAEPGVADTLARIDFSGLASNGRSDLSIVGEGIEPDREARLGTALRMLAGRQLTDGDAFGALVGAGVAEALHVGVGDRLVLVVSTPQGALNTLDFDVVGIFQTLSKDFDDRAVRIPLPAARELIDSAGASAIVVALDRTENTDIVARALRVALAGTGYDARTWIELNDFYEKAVNLYERQFGVLTLIILAMVVLSVANSINMTLFERTAEFGTMRALGRRPRDIARTIVVESALLGLAGALAGVVLGIGLALAISQIGIPMPPPPNANVGYTAHVLVRPMIVAEAFAVGFGASVLATILPAWRLSRMPIVEALRHGI